MVSGRYHQERRICLRMHMHYLLLKDIAIVRVQIPCPQHMFIVDNTIYCPHHSLLSRTQCFFH